VLCDDDTYVLWESLLHVLGHKYAPPHYDPMLQHLYIGNYNENNKVHAPIDHTHREAARRGGQGEGRYRPSHDPYTHPPLSLSLMYIEALY
jgi:hypothetical protein